MNYVRAYERARPNYIPNYISGLTIITSCNTLCYMYMVEVKHFKDYSQHKFIGTPCLGKNHTSSSGPIFSRGEFSSTH